MKVLIMAGGAGARWIGGRIEQKLRKRYPVYKQHILIGDETIIGRTVRMLGEFGIDGSETVVIGPCGVWNALAVEGCALPGEPGPLLAALKDTNDLWDRHRTTVLLGDVVFSYKALDMLLNNEAQIQFVGRFCGNPITGKKAAELFGFSMTFRVYGWVMRHCREMTARGVRLNYPAKLWALYRLMCGFEHDEYKHEDRILRDPQDYTDDIDSVEEHSEFVFPLAAAAFNDVPVAMGLQEQGA